MSTPSIDSSSTDRKDTIYTPTSSELHFPIPEGVDDKVTNWLLKHPDPVETMGGHSVGSAEDPSNLGGSAYELVDDDVESGDGNATESVASTEYTRPEDVICLDETESGYSDSESGDSHVTDGTPAFSGLDENTDTPTIGQSAMGLLEGSTPIVFDESHPLKTIDDLILVQHPVKELSENEIKAITPHLITKIGGLPPRRISASIRQTMTERVLSASVPLRILYVGSHSAKQDIIHKIASAVAATGSDDGSLSGGSPQFFNVVPVSAFGSQHTPEIELMASSGYQIVVEDCLKATDSTLVDGRYKPGVLKLTLDHNFSHSSVPEGNEYHIQPKWQLPHVAIFYCSDNDTDEMRCTRRVAISFMTRHEIPSVFISHRQMLEPPIQWQTLLDHHPIHLSVEAQYMRNVTLRTATISLPIDLASFVNIDPRQLNRNFAHITRWSQPHAYPVTSTTPIPRIQAISKSASQPRWIPESLAKPLVAGIPEAQAVPGSALSRNAKLPNTRKFVHWPVPFLSSVIPESQALRQTALPGDAKLRNPVRSHNRRRWWDLAPLRVLIAAVLASALVSFYNFKTLPANLVSINGNLTVTHPSPIVIGTSTTASESIAVCNGLGLCVSRPEARTSTKIITVVEVRTPGSTSLSGSTAAKEVSKVTEKSAISQSPKDEPSRICAAERIGDQEILIRIPPATKLSWLAKEAMSVNVTRGNQTIDTERVYISNEGIILYFPRKEAYGVLNISVITTKKPKVNQTFQVDFGSSWSHELYDAFDKISHHVYDDVLPSGFTLDAMMARVQSWSSYGVKHAHHLAETSRKRAEESGWRAVKRVAESRHRLATRAQSIRSDLASRGAEASKEFVERVREPLGNAVLRAQIRSQLRWLRMRGRFAEAREYEKRASEAVAARRGGGKGKEGKRAGGRKAAA